MPQVPIFVINLDRSPERLDEIAALMERYKLNFQRIPAVDGKELDIDYKRSITKTHRGKIKLSDGEIGCYLSHVQAFKKIVDEKLDYAIIMEDDATFDSAFVDLIANIPFKSINADLIKFEGFLRPKIKYINVSEYKNYNILFPDLVSFGTAAYLVTFRGAHKLLKYSRKLKRPADHALFRYWENNMIIYEVHPFPVTQKGSLSTIGDDRAKARKKNRGWRGVWRKVKTEISRTKRGVMTFTIQVRHFGFKAFSKKSIDDIA